MIEGVDFRLISVDKDQHYIYSTWLNSFFRESYFASKIPHGIFFKSHHNAIEAILKRPDTVGIIAHPKNEPDVILGYIVAEALPVPVLHYIYIKGAFRRMGIARELLEQSQLSQDEMVFSHWTYAVNKILIKLPGLQYDPYKL